MIRDINLIGFNIFFLLDLYLQKKQKKAQACGAMAQRVWSLKSSVT